MSSSAQPERPARLLVGATALLAVALVAVSLSLSGGSSAVPEDDRDAAVATYQPTEGAGRRPRTRAARNVEADSAATATDAPAASSGGVRDERGAPVTDALVEIRRRRDGVLETDPDVVARSDSRGEFAVCGLGAGPVNVRCRPTDRTQPSAAFVATDLETTFDGRRLDLVVSRGEMVRGVVRATDGTGVRAQLEVFEVTPGGPRFLGLAPTSPSGEFAYGGLPAARLRLVATPRDADALHERGVGVLDVATPHLAPVLLEPRTSDCIRGIVVDESGRPVPGATLLATLLRRRERSPRPMSVRVTDAHGRFLVAQTEPGVEYALDVAGQLRWTDARARGGSSGVCVVLREGARVCGWVKRGEGPIANLRVVAQVEGTDRVAGESVTDEDGWFLIGRLEENRRYVLAVQTGGVSSDRTVTPSVAFDPLEIDLP